MADAWSLCASFCCVWQVQERGARQGDSADRGEARQDAAGRRRWDNTRAVLSLTRGTMVAVLLPPTQGISSDVGCESTPTHSHRTGVDKLLCFLSVGAVSSPADTGADREAEGGDEKHENGTPFLPYSIHFQSPQVYTPPLQSMTAEADGWACDGAWQRG